MLWSLVVMAIVLAAIGRLASARAVLASLLAFGGAAVRIPIGGLRAARTQAAIPAVG